MYTFILCIYFCGLKPQPVTTDYTSHRTLAQEEEEEEADGGRQRDSAVQSRDGAAGPPLPGRPSPVAMPLPLPAAESHKALRIQGHMKGESQLPAASFACGCELEGLGVVPSALEAF